MYIHIYIYIYNDRRTILIYYTRSCERYEKGVRKTCERVAKVGRKSCERVAKGLRSPTSGSPRLRVPLQLNVFRN